MRTVSRTFATNGSMPSKRNANSTVLPGSVSVNAMSGVNVTNISGVQGTAVAQPQPAHWHSRIVCLCGHVCVQEQVGITINAGILNHNTTYNNNN